MWLETNKNTHSYLPLNIFVQEKLVSTGMWLKMKKYIELYALEYANVAFSNEICDFLGQFLCWWIHPPIPFSTLMKIYLNPDSKNVFLYPEKCFLFQRDKIDKREIPFFPMKIGDSRFSTYLSNGRYLRKMHAIFVISTTFSSKKSWWALGCDSKWKNT